jgi:hypothetical protein
LWKRLDLWVFKQIDASLSTKQVRSHQLSETGKGHGEMRARGLQDNDDHHFILFMDSFYFIENGRN